MAHWNTLRTSWLFGFQASKHQNSHQVHDPLLPHLLEFWNGSTCLEHPPSKGGRSLPACKHCQGHRPRWSPNHNLKALLNLTPNGVHSNHSNAKSQYSMLTFPIRWNEMTMQEWQRHGKRFQVPPAECIAAATNHGGQPDTAPLQLWIVQCQVAPWIWKASTFKFKPDNYGKLILFNERPKNDSWRNARGLKCRKWTSHNLCAGPMLDLLQTHQEFHANFAEFELACR